MDASLAVASTSDSPTTALVAMHNISLVVANSKFEGLHVTMDTLLLFVNSSITLQNTTFTDNQAPFTGAVAATSMQQLTVSHSTFTSNVGRELWLAQPQNFCQHRQSLLVQFLST